MGTDYQYFTQNKHKKIQKHFFVLFRPLYLQYN